MGSITPIAQSIAGLVAFPLIAWLLRERHATFRAVDAVRIAAIGLGLQFAIAALLLGVPVMQSFFSGAAHVVATLQTATQAGTRVVFGYLAGGPTPFDVTKPQNSFILAIHALPLILVVSVLSRLLYHWGILQKVIGAFSWALQRTLGVGGPLGTASAANIFVGMVEAPLLIRPYVAQMDRSTLFAMMTVGMATVAGTVMALYASLLEPSLPGAAGHVIAASVMSAPAALVIAWLMVPPDRSGDMADDEIDAVLAHVDRSEGIMHAIADSTLDGLKLLAQVAAILVVMVALVALANSILAGLAEPFGLSLSFEKIAGWLCAPLAWLAGIPWHEAVTAGGLIGVKVVLNEFLAYLQLAGLPEADLSDRSRLIMTYVLCGFANFGSLGIMVAGLAAIAPERRVEIAKLGPRTIISGMLTTLLTGAVVGTIVWS